MVGGLWGTPRSGALVWGQADGACRKDGLCSSAKLKIKVDYGIYSLWDISSDFRAIMVAKW